ncbi:hypothetical protein CSKR_101781 [Clonorchis sinensis]|uniref:Uncharacterized protein n=2 Tax=Clonorchis sinensis TaxID=79923 RepID=A0A419PHC7_CLOSI|nr:hypothetical protein CSKR_101781 [Clonorchis sinensis]
MFRVQCAFLLLVMTTYTAPSSPNEDSPNVALHLGGQASNMRLFPRSVVSFDQPVDESFDEAEPMEKTENKPITYAFIENIVKRTFAEYMRVIQTQSDWLQHLLQLVREERNIRSRYNCSTDACIYKIQLFTHHLHPHIFPHIRPSHKKRARRSVQDSEPMLDSGGMERKTELSNPFNDGAGASPEEFTHAESKGVPTRDLSMQDDALRLSDALLVNTADADATNLDHASSKKDEEGSHPQFSNFGDTNKFNMERVSQKVLSEALSRKNKPPLSSREGGMAMESETRDTPDSPQQTDSKQQTTSGVQTESHPLELSPSDPVASIDNSMATTILSTYDSATERTSVDTVRLQATAPVNEQHAAPSVSPQKASHLSQFLSIDLTVPAIPFGMNKFGGNPYEDCSGRFENYCYNADKCVYISVLETAACYCRTGYTGVRCDMYNLPQSLDILKSFTDGVIDTDMLSNVVEATARYTVNAALEEDVLAHWPMEDVP